jgi:hypothetical protein
VQSHDDEDEDDDFSVLFQVMEHRSNENDGKIEVLGQKPVPVPLCPPQMPHGLTQD